jgi:CheY-like chemotaxis protein
MMGGSIGIESGVGKGTTFTIYLPAEDRDQRKQDSLSNESGEAEVDLDRRTSGGTQALVIDDDPNARELVQRILEDAGYSVTCASSGKRGLELAKSLKPRLITLDILMPGMDGWAVLRELKADPELEHIPVTMVSFAGDREMGYMLGAVESLNKPVDRSALRNIAQRYARHRVGRIALVVEDEEASRIMLRRTMEDDGWAVDEAENGAVALDRVTARKPDLILLDLMMPVTDGFDFLVELRKKDGCSTIPVVIVTAKDLTEDERRRLAGTVEPVVQKGALTYQQILDQVRELAAKHVQKSVSP